MKAVILAAGRGTRLKHLTKNKPKCLLEFMGKTLLKRQISTFRRNEITEIIVVTGYQDQKIKAEGVHFIKNEKYADTNMVVSLFKTRKMWDSPIIVSYGDILFEDKVLSSLISSKKDINVVVDLNGKDFFKERLGNDYLSDIESLVLDKDNETITELGSPHPDDSMIQGQYIGLMKFSPKGLEIMSQVYDQYKTKFWNKPWMRSKNFKNAYMTDMLQKIINRGTKVYAVKVVNGWLEFDTVKDYEKYLKAEELLLKVVEMSIKNFIPNLKFSSSNSFHLWRHAIN
ncbi:hypothetical protein LCGC14_1563800 [marine sediment metagenome]|uniref:MobA-like NTP transferase domain-containing protein n=1 Tax=marine sediment metagenome TaxID=412755 RepID=A0A0F9LMC7_9ZZZZ